jgi:hypothetical protein
MRGLLGGLGLERAHVTSLLLECLEASMTELGGSIDELESNCLACSDSGLRQKALTKSEHTLLRTSDTTLDHHPVLINVTIVREATHGCDALHSQILVGTATAAVTSLAHTVHLLVNHGTVMVTILSSACHVEAHTGRMPGTDTPNLAETTVGLAGKAAHAPTGCDTRVTVTTGRTTDVDHLISVEHGANGHLLLQELLGEGDLGSDVTSIDLNLQQMGLLLAQTNFLDLGMGNHTHHLAILSDALQLGLDVLGLISVLLGVLGERLPLAAVPVFVEATAHFLAQMVSPHGGEGAKTTGSLDVANNSDNNHRRGLNDGHSLHNLLLVDLGARLVSLAHDVSHTGLVTHESSEVRLGSGIIRRETADLSPVLLGALAGKESEGTVTRGFELAVGHC